MRKLDDVEIRILKNIKNLSSIGSELTFIALLDNYIRDRGVKIDFDRKKAYILFDALKYSRLEGATRTPQQALEGEAKELVKVFIKIIIFIQYLEREGYLYKIQGFKKEETTAIYARIVNDKVPISIEIQDSNLVLLIIEFYTLHLFINEDSINNLLNLYEFSEDDYLLEGTEKGSDKKYSKNTVLAEGKTILNKIEKSLLETLHVMEDFLILSERRIRYADLALGVSIVLGILCIGVSGLSTFYTFKKLDESTQLLGVELDPLQQRLTNIEEGFSRIYKKMDEIKINDTIHARIVGMPMDTLHTNIVNFPKDYIRNRNKIRILPNLN